MKTTRGFYFFLLLGLALAIILTDLPLQAKNRGKGQGKGNKQNWEEKEKRGKSEKFRRGRIPDAARISGPPQSAWRHGKDGGQKEKKYHFNYYPDLGMYYNRDTNFYYWLKDGKWAISPQRPDWAFGGRYPYIDFDLYYPTPYLDHPWVIESYPVTPVIVPGKRPPPHAPAWGYRRKYRYHYYPTDRVYYNLDTKTYFWIDGGKWKLGLEIPTGVILNDSDRVGMVLGQPWPY